MVDFMGEDLAAQLRAFACVAVSAVDADSSALGSRFQATYNTMQLVRSNLLSDCNSRHRLLSLPLGVLHRIFGFVQPDDSWSLSQTCRSLRSSCLAVSSLWRTVPSSFYVDDARIRLISLFAQRSHPDVFDLDLDYVFTLDPLNHAAISLLADSMPRLRRLSVLPFSSSRRQRILDVLLLPAPHLETLKLGNFDQFDPFLHGLPYGLLGGEADRLENLELVNIPLVLSGDKYPALSNLRTFHWHELQLAFDETAFRSLLALLPRLERLQLSIRRFSWSSHGVPLSDPHTLRRLNVHSVEYDNVLACARAVGLSQLHVNGRDLAHRPLVAELSKRPLVAALGSYACELVEKRGDCLPDVYDPPRGADHSLTIGGGVLLFGDGANISFTPFGVLTQLTLHEFYWPEAAVVVPPLPMLHTLRVTLAACVSHRDWAWEGPLGILPGARCSNLAAWSAPALRILHIAYCPPISACKQKYAGYQRPTAAELASGCCCHAVSLSVSLYDVHRFVTSCFALDTLCLSELRLIGVESIDTDPWPAFDLLQGLSMNFAISSIAVPTRFEIVDQECALRAPGFFLPV